MCANAGHIIWACMTTQAQQKSLMYSKDITSPCHYCQLYSPKYTLHAANVCKCTGPSLLQFLAGCLPRMLENIHSIYHLSRFSQDTLFDAVCNKLDALRFFNEVDEEGPALDSPSIFSPAPPPLATHLPELLNSFSSCLVLVFGPSFLLTCFLAFCALTSAFVAFSSSFSAAFRIFSSAFFCCFFFSSLSIFRFSFSSCSSFFFISFS